MSARHRPVPSLEAPSDPGPLADHHVRLIGTLTELQSSFNAPNCNSLDAGCDSRVNHALQPTPKPQPTEVAASSYRAQHFLKPASKRQNPEVSHGSASPDVAPDGCACAADCAPAGSVAEHAETAASGARGDRCDHDGACAAGTGSGRGGVTPTPTAQNWLATIRNRGAEGFSYAHVLRWEQPDLEAVEFLLASGRVALGGDGVVRAIAAEEATP